MPDSAPPPVPPKTLPVSPAVQAAATTGATAGIAAAKAAAEFGSMGLSGTLKLLGNTTAMVLIAGFLIVVYRDMRTDTQAQRQAAGQESVALVAAIHELRAESAATRQAVEALTIELRSRPPRP